MYFADKLMKESGVNLIAYSTCHYEKTDFKTGFCGLEPASLQNLDDGGVRLNSLKKLEKVKLLYYYAKQFSSNPSYLNSSIVDSFTAFLSYYFIKQDFLYLFDYVEWDEDLINDTLINKYNWELSPDTPTTWRIGDGTAALYNYIYRHVAGFDEFDTFRSNQIREGVLTRDEALKKLNEEQVDRLPSIKEYCDLLDLNFNTLMNVIHKIPRLY
jgi:hypothetical protein